MPHPCLFVFDSEAFAFLFEPLVANVAQDESNLSPAFDPH